MMLPTALLASCSANTSANGVNGQTSHVAPHFNCHNLRNTMVPLMLLLEACETDVSANGLKFQKSHVGPHFNCLNIRNALVPLTILLVLHARAGTNSSTWPKGHVAPHFQNLDLRNAMVLSTTHNTEINSGASCDTNVMPMLVSVV